MLATFVITVTYPVQAIRQPGEGREPAARLLRQPGKQLAR